MKNSKIMKQLFLLFFMIFSSVTTYGSVTQLSLKVGDAKFVSIPKPPISGAIIDVAKWGGETSNISLKEADQYGAIICVEKYFDGTARIEAWYAYHWYDNNNFLHSSNGVAYYYITCIGSNVSLNTTYIELCSGERYELKVSGVYYPFVPDWSSDDNSVAQVDDNGIITACSAGSAMIKCDPIVGPVLYCQVIVKSVEPNYVEISPSSLNLVVGDSEYLKARLSPDVAVTTLTWSSNNADIASVNQNGYVTAMCPGDAIITVKTSNGLVAHCKIKVLSLPTKVQLPANIELMCGFSTILTPILEPSNSQTTYTWSTSDSSIVTVSSEGKLTGVSVGTAEITVKTYNDLTARCYVSVKEAPENISIIQPKIYRISNLIDNTKSLY